MLVDIPYSSFCVMSGRASLSLGDDVIGLMNTIYDTNSHWLPVEHVGTGIYKIVGFGLDHRLRDVGIEVRDAFDLFALIDEGQNREDRIKSLQSYWDWEKEVGAPPSYGVCDYPQQVAEKFPYLIDGPERLVMQVTELVGSEQPAQGGWRWHKWGEYIGDQDPQCEYLYDEPEIEKVFVFHIYELV